MEAQEFQELVKKVGEEAAIKIKSEFDAVQTKHAEELKKATDGLATKAAIEEMQTKHSEELKKLEEAARKQGEEITAMKNAGAATDQINKGIGAVFAEEVSKRKSDWDAMKAKSAPFEIELKSAGTMTTANVPTAGNSFVPSQQLLPGYTEYKTNEPLVLQYANVMRTNSRTVNWVDETAGEGDAGWTAEGAAKPLEDVNVTVRSVTATKVAVAFKASEESLADIPFLQSLIETRGRRSLNLKIDDGLINGDGTSDQPYGIAYYAPGFTSTEMNDTVEDPNYYDALGAAATQIIRANFSPNVVFINPVDWFKMMHTKDGEQRYVLLSLQLQNGNFLNMTAVKSNQVPVGTFIMGDMTYFEVAIREDIRLEIGWENDDFRKNLRTIIIEGRLSSFVRENNKLAFCMETYETVMDAIDATV